MFLQKLLLEQKQLKFYKTKMRKIFVFLATMISALTLSAATMPEESTAENPVWYIIQFVKDSPVLEAQASGAEVKTARANEADAQAWRVEGDSKAGYTFISRNGQTLYVNNTQQNNGFFYSAVKPTSNTRFDIVQSTVSGSTDGFLIAPHGTSVYANQWQGSGVGKRLGLWTADAGCVVRFVKEADFDFSYQPVPAQATEVSITGKSIVPEEPLTLWYKSPAKDWTTEALPIGNGDMGAMVFGGIAQDRLQFNHKAFWRGGSGANDLGTYLNFGELYIINKSAASATAYQRRLNLREAVAQVEYKDAKASYQREYLASNPDQVLAVRYTPSQGAPLNLQLQFINICGTRATYTNDGAVFSGTLDNGLGYCATLRVEQKGGSATTTKNGIDISDASELTLYITCGTTYDATVSSHMSGTVEALKSQQAATLTAAQNKGYDAVRADHVADYQALFNRVDFQLDGAANKYTTGELLQKTLQTSQKMVDMLVFQYGRYLTIASSRGVPLPSNLQGIWCQDGSATSSATWASDIHTNINVQMNYWPVESTNLSECHMPLLDFLYNEALRSGGGWQKNASNLGVSTGWVVNTASNIFGGSSNYKVGKYSCANAWLCTHLWQHYAYTQDKDFLRLRAFPVMKAACDFWFKRLVTASDGTLECPNEYSPEQGKPQNATAHSQQLVTQLFLDTQKAIDILGDEADCNATFKSNLKTKLAKIDRGLRIDKNGLLREWKYMENTPNQPADQNYFADDESNVWQGHRHMSHLMDLYPLFEIDPGNDADIYKAAVASLKDRGDVATGWGRAWRTALWARTGDAKQTYTTLRGFAHRTTSTSYDWHGGLYDNLLDAHATSVFQIEGNFGATAAIAEMLLQSRPDSLVLLPTLPTQWAAGHIKGLKAIGNFEVGLTWSEGHLTTVTVRSLAGLPLVLAYPDIERAVVATAEGQRVEPAVSEKNRLGFSTSVGATYTVSWNETSAITRTERGASAVSSVFDLQGRPAPADVSGIVVKQGRKTVIPQ